MILNNRREERLGMPIAWECPSLNHPSSFRRAARAGGGPHSFSDQSASEGGAEICSVFPFTAYLPSTLPQTTENGGTSCWKKKCVISTRPSLGLALSAGQVRWETTDGRAAGLENSLPKGINDFRGDSAAAGAWKTSTGLWTGRVHL